jgi:hypothetical protein
VLLRLTQCARGSMRSAAAASSLRPGSGEVRLIYGGGAGDRDVPIPNELSAHLRDMFIRCNELLRHYWACVPITALYVPVPCCACVGLSVGLSVRLSARVLVCVARSLTRLMLRAQDPRKGEPPQNSAREESQRTRCMRPVSSPL